MQCPQGHPVQPGQQFCSECGAPISDTSPPSPPERNKTFWPTNRRLFAIGASLLVLLVGGVILLPRERHDLEGRLVLTGQIFEAISVGADLLSAEPEEVAENIPRGSPCSGSGGYSDIDERQGVRVRDEDGTLLGTGRLEQGKVSEASQDGFLVIVACSFEFEVDELPGADFYAVEIGGRTGAEYSAKELDDAKWNISMSLGP
jgi:hypothetical protein